MSTPKRIYATARRQQGILRWLLPIFVLLAVITLLGALLTFTFWLVVLGVLAWGMVAGLSWLSWHTRRLLDRFQNVKQLRRLDPTDFEHYCAVLFKKLGYRTRVVGGAGDMGVDFFAEKDGKKYVGQCKRYRFNKKVTSPEMQKFVGTMKIYNCNHGLYVTTSSFTPDAIRIARAQGITLIDELELGRLNAKAFGTQ